MDLVILYLGGGSGQAVDQGQQTFRHRKLTLLLRRQCGRDQGESRANQGGL